jgi:type VI secretion system protein ImpK
MREGRLGVYLASGRETVTVNDNDLAVLVSDRLKALLQQQAKGLAAVGTQAQYDAYLIAQYAMAALADELLILEVQWPGSRHWSECPLEQRLFESSRAGQDVFARIDDLLAARAPGPWQEDLAAVFLMCLRLGFKGQHRGMRGAQRLKDYNTRLIRFTGTTSLKHQPACVQAYQYLIAGTVDERLAPLSRWYRLGAIGIAIYLLVSTVVWVVLTNRFMAVFGGG